MKNISLLLLIVFGLYSVSSKAQESLELQYMFNQVPQDGSRIIDDSGNGYEGTIMSGASIRQIGNINVLDLGAENGYLDLGASVGTIIGSLTDFSISTYVYVDENTNLLAAGNFVWAFGNSTNLASEGNGGMFFNASASRYAISLIHWYGEQNVRYGSPLVKGEWVHLTYTQEGTLGKIFINGVKEVENTISLYPKDLGQTAYNFLGRSLYSNDVYLKNASYTDFRIYSKALTQNNIDDLLGSLIDLNNDIYLQQLQNEASGLDLGDITQVSSDLELPLSGTNEIAVSWESSNTNVLSNDGTIFRPAFGEDAVSLDLVATFSKSGVSFEKTYHITVLPFVSDQLSVERDAQNILLTGNLDNLKTNITLLTKGDDGSVISWDSDHETNLSAQGELLQFSVHGEGKLKVTLVATITKGSYSEQRSFDVYIAEDEGFSAYLFAYFTGNSIEEEAIRFAVSNNGYNYMALNNNNPVVASSEISSTGGVRDPHILRGPDGNYYMVVTDMVSANGWSSNRAMVLLKSSDLINWQSSVVNIQDKYANQENLERVWAPQSIYDASVDKYMLYWSMKYIGGPDIIYYAYANSTFTDIEGEPQQLFFHPDNVSCIDGDIVFKDGNYHLFFKTEGSGNGIKKAVSNQLTSDYVLIDKYLQQTTSPVEGSSVFKLINSDEYILMYDMYSSGSYQFTKGTDLENFTVVDEEVSMNFHPRHGTVIPITSEEADLLMEKWGSEEDLMVMDVEGEDIVPESIDIDNTNKVINLVVKEGTDLSTFTPTLVVMPGVKVSLNNYSNGMYTYSISITGLEAKTYHVYVNMTTDRDGEKIISEGYKLFPNPTSTWLNVYCPLNEDGTNVICIYDYSGKKMFTKNMTDNNTQINVQSLSSNAYIIAHLHNQKILWSDQFVKL